MIRMVGGTDARQRREPTGGNAGEAGWPAAIGHLMAPDRHAVVLDMLVPDAAPCRPGSRIEKPTLLLAALSRQQAGMMAPGPGAAAPVFSKIELVDRMRDAARCQTEADAKPPACRAMTIGGQEVVVSRRLVDVTSREYAILELIVLYSGVVLTRGALTDAADGHLMKVATVFDVAWRRADQGSPVVCPAVCRSPSPSISAPNSTTNTESHIQVSRTSGAPSEP